MVSDYTDLRQDQHEDRANIKANHKDVVELERRVIVIEAKVDTINSKLDTILDWLGWFFKTSIGAMIVVLVTAWLMNGGLS